MDYTPHCQICERDIKAKQGVIAHHGYTRPYPQEQTRSCDGARQLPYEVSRDAIPTAIDNTKAFLGYQQDRLKAYMKEGPEELTRVVGYGRPVQVMTRPENFDPKHSAENWETSPAKGYEREFYSTIRQIKRNIETAKQEVTRLTLRYDNWVKVA